ncbi:hypothetical protein G7Y89_g7306 [Cudoniella acicularis]|uniref:Uncharacterized protein n=1 Tax=Cudoniella acicularis TaxID=354080 RepID=A0A8H4RMC5_9HELO|nr:hypothetical protein G7Y89_g7306 [Cudoniella acicularis]
MRSAHFSLPAPHQIAFESPPPNPPQREKAMATNQGLKFELLHHILTQLKEKSLLNKRNINYERIGQEMQITQRATREQFMKLLAEIESGVLWGGVPAIPRVRAPPRPRRAAAAARKPRVKEDAEIKAEIKEEDSEKGAKKASKRKKRVRFIKKEEENSDGKISDGDGSQTLNGDEDIARRPRKFVRFEDGSRLEVLEQGEGNEPVMSGGLGEFDIAIDREGERGFVDSVGVDVAAPKIKIEKCSDDEVVGVGFIGPKIKIERCCDSEGEGFYLGAGGKDALIQEWLGRVDDAGTGGVYLKDEEGLRAGAYIKVEEDDECEA